MNFPNDLTCSKAGSGFSYKKLAVAYAFGIEYIFFSR